MCVGGQAWKDKKIDAYKQHMCDMLRLVLDSEGLRGGGVGGWGVKELVCCWSGRRRGGRAVNLTAFVCN